MKIRIIQVPYDSGYKNLRQGVGPAHFIQHDLDKVLEAEDHQVEVTHIDAKSPFTTEIGTAFELNRLLSDEVRTAIGNGQFPMVLSGNCNSCLGTIAGINSEQLGIVWFDAHGEFNTPETTQSGFFDGMPLAMATGRCWKAILKTIPGFVPVKAANVILVGARDLDPEEGERLQQSGVNVIGSEGRSPDLLLKSIEAELIKLRDRATDVYLHIDMDAFLIERGAANHFGVSGGLTPEFVEASIKVVKKYFTLQAGAVASFDPTFDTSGRFLKAGIRCIRQIVTEGK